MLMKNPPHSLIHEMEAWFSKCTEHHSISFKKMPLEDNKDWKFTTTIDGKVDTIQHKTERMYKIVSLRAWEPLRNEWVDRCMIEPIPEGKNNVFSMVLLAIYDGKYLVQAKAEPGNNTPHRLVLTSTVQSSFVNLSMALSGRPPFVDFYDDPACVIFPIIQDGGQFLNKINDLCIIELKQPPKVIPDNFYWATLEQIAHFAKKGLVSEHLLQTLGVLLLSR